MDTRYDIVISGAGITGATLAALLASPGAGTPWSVLLLDPRPAPRPGGPPLRVSAITRATEETFREAGAWPAMEASPACPIRAMHVWEDGAQVTFDAAEIGEPHLGHILVNDVMVAALLQRLSGTGVAYRPETALASVTPAPQGWRLRLDGGEEVQARLLVGADGAASAVRRFAGIPYPGWSYGQHGLVARVTTERPHQEEAWQRFLPGGPLACLPLADGGGSIVWSLPSHEARRLVRCPRAEFEQALTRAFQGRLGTMGLGGERAVFPLSMHHAETYWREGLVLLGDAAHRIHPLAGQGANLGVADAAALAECLCDGLAAGRPPGHPRDLARWSRRRRAENLVVMAAMEGFAQLYAPAHPLARRVRGLGMRAFDLLAPLKQAAMRRASGLTGDLPRAARPHYARDPWV